MDEPEAAWRLWRDRRDELFASHPQSPLPAEARVRFAGVPYFGYDPALRVFADVEPAEPERREIATSGDRAYSLTRFGRAGCSAHGEGLPPDLCWRDGDGGGECV